MIKCFSSTVYNKASFAAAIAAIMAPLTGTTASSGICITVVTGAGATVACYASGTAGGGNGVAITETGPEAGTENNGDEPDGYYSSTRRPYIFP